MSLVYRVFRMFSLLALAGVLAACAGLPGGSGGREQVLLKQLPTAEFLSEPQSLLVGGQVASLYVNPVGRIAFSLGASTQLLDEGAPVRGGKYLTLQQSGNTLYALWWSHQNAKALYFSASQDGGKSFAPVQIVNTDHGVLPPYQFLADESGVLAAAYHDERIPGYQIYFNRSDASGTKWQEKDLRLDNAQAVSGALGGAPAPQAQAPQLARLGQNLVVTWQEGAKSGQRVVSRMSPDMGKTWQKEVEIYLGSQLPSALQLIVVGQQMVLVGDISGAGVQAWRTLDAGRTWQAMGALPGSAEFVNSQIRLASAGDRVYAVYTAEKSEKKSQIQVGVLDATQGKWLAAAQRLDPKEIDLTKSISPDIAALPGGGAVAVWQDFRTVRPNVYLSYSGLDGKSWSPALAVQQGEGQFGALTPRVAAQGALVRVFYQRFVDDGRTKTDYTLAALKIDAKTGALELAPGAPAVSAEQKKNRLRERVDGFWRLRTEENFDATYGYFDPAYRSTTSHKSFSSFQGNLRFQSYQIDKLEILGNIAKVSVKTKFEVLPTEVMGRQFSQPPTDAFMTNEWVWMHDEWFMVYQSPLGNRALEY